MKRYSGRFIIKSTRVKNWDYSTPGWYFITICTTDHDNYFGEICNNKIEYSVQGKIAIDCLNGVEKHFNNVKIIESVVMPNHVHILFKLSKSSYYSVETQEKSGRDVACYVSTNNKTSNEKLMYFSDISPKHNSVSTIIRSYKSAVTHIIRPMPGFFGWQSRFYDEIIRDEKHLLFVKNYIIDNIKNWKKDKFYETQTGGI